MTDEFRHRNTDRMSKLTAGDLPVPADPGITVGGKVAAPGITVGGKVAACLLAWLTVDDFEVLTAEVRMPLETWREVLQRRAGYGEAAAEVERLILGIPGVQGPDAPDSGAMALGLIADSGREMPKIAP